MTSTATQTSQFSNTLRASRYVATRLRTAIAASLYGSAASVKRCIAVPSAAVPAAAATSHAAAARGPIREMGSFVWRGPPRNHACQP